MTTSTYGSATRQRRSEEITFKCPTTDERIVSKRDQRWVTDYEIKT
jgi:hypothetical protein